MKIRRTLSIVLAVALLCTLMAGCGSGGGGEKNAAGDKPNRIVIIGSAYALEEEQKAWDEVCSAFTAETGIEVVQNRQGTWDDIPQKLQASKLGQEQIDLVVVGMGTITASLGPAGSVMDLTQLMAGLTDRFPEGVLDSCSIDGHLWCFPYSDASGTTCFYNKTMFQQYDLTVPTNLQEWAHCAKVLSDNGIIPFMVQGKDTWAWAMPFFDTYGQATGGQSVEKVQAWLRGEQSFADPQVYAAFDGLKALYDNGILTSESFDTDETGMLANFAQGKCAMFFCGTWDYGVLKSMELDFDYGAFEFPVVIDGAQMCHAFATGDGAISIPSWVDQNNLDNIMRFVEYLTRTENAKKILCASSGGSPLFEIVKGATGEVDEVTRFLNEVSVPHSVEYLDWVWPSKVNDAMCNVIPSVISGKMTSQEAADYVQQTLDTMVSEDDYVYDWWNSWSDEQWQAVTPGHIPDVTAFFAK